jgi:hypothetical protein
MKLLTETWNVNINTEWTQLTKEKNKNPKCIICRNSADFQSMANCIRIFECGGGSGSLEFYLCANCFDQHGKKVREKKKLGGKDVIYSFKF